MYGRRNVEERVEALAEELEPRIEMVQKQLRGGVERLSEVIGHHPGKSLLVAFVAGFGIAKLLRGLD